MRTSSDHEQPAGGKEFLFGPFRFIPRQQLLLQGEARLRLGGRALDILKTLLERSGELVSKRELIARVWPDNVVDDSNVKVHIAALRQALGAGPQGNGYIATVSGRGYCFVAPVCVKGAGPARRDPAPAMHALPAPAARMLGRADTVADLLRTLAQHRIASIVGPGGIGKTTIALALAQAFGARAGIDVCFVDLSPLAGAQFVAGAVAAALGLPAEAEGDAQSLVAGLRQRRLLLVLDSCEHMVDSVAVLAEQIVRAAPGVTLLATSREPLRAAGESVHRLAPLAFPAREPAAAQCAMSAAAALRFPAVQLFAERAAECLEGYRLTDADAPAVAEICRRLEGIPLAIELAAMRIDAFGARELAARLDDRFRLLKRGRRSAQPRHSTLAAALDWSYAFLPQDERALLRRLAVFAGAFTLDAATRLCGCAPDGAAQLVDAISNLVAKSMLSADVGGAAVSYRLLDTTKAYALDKLEQAGEMGAVRRRHAVFLCALLQDAAREWQERPSAGWLASYGRHLDDVRGALAWAFSDAGDAALGSALTVGAIPLWMGLALLEECRACAGRALRRTPLAPREEMALRAALATAVLYACGPVDETRAAWTRTLALADALQDRDFQLRALWGLAVCRSYAGDHRAVRRMVQRARALAQDGVDGVDGMDGAGGASDAALASFARLVATALHYGGDQPAARRHLERMLGHYVTPRQCANTARFQLDQRSAALGTLANVLWLQDCPEPALRMADAAVQEARDAGHVPSLLNVYAHAAFPILLAAGQLDAAERVLDDLAELLSQRALTLWHTLSRCLRALLRLQRGEASALCALRAALDELRGAGFRLRMASYLGALAAAFGAQGRPAEGLAYLGEALAVCEAGEEHWCHPELLRIKGDLLRASDAAAAGQLHRQALELATSQGALYWRRRAENSLSLLASERPGALVVFTKIYKN
jgi:predicted ATPase/DNA-binding winged helix-turn-helix (wHTH) protein